jgi:hypothetical protein
VDVSARKTNAFDADGEVALSRSPDAGIKFAGDKPASDGGQKARRTEETAYKP